MRPVMGTDALAWHRQRLAGGSFAENFGATHGLCRSVGGSFIIRRKGRNMNAQYGSIDPRIDYSAERIAYIQQNYLIRLCSGHLGKLEARYHKAQAEIWHHRAKQLEAESQDLCSRAEALQDRVGWYRARYHELKEENMRLRARLARYAELEKKLDMVRESNARKEH